jgi:hypothetical protein
MASSANGGQAWKHAKRDRRFDEAQQQTGPATQFAATAYFESFAANVKNWTA